MSLFFAFLLCLAGGASAAGPGTGAANFLKVPVGARESGLGGAFTAVAEGHNAVFYNPAGLALAGQAELGYSYNNYVSGMSQHSAAAVIPFSYGGWGLGVNYFQVAPFPAYDAQDNRTGEVSAYGLAAALGYGGSFGTGLPFLPSVAYGAAARYVAESLDDTAADGAAADAGLLLQTGLKGLRLGLAAENAAATRLDFYGAGARPARRLKTGASLLIRGRPVTALLSAEAVSQEDGASYVSAGLENVISGVITLRAGYTSLGDLSGGVTYGLGLALPERFGAGARLDYSFGSTYDLGNIHRFGLAWKFGGAAGAPLTEALERTPLPADPAAGTPGLDALYGADPAASAQAAEDLAKAEPRRAMQHLPALLSSGRRDWKLAALRGLAVCADPAAGELLASGLRDEDPEVRRSAAQLLGRSRYPGAADALQDALRREDSERVKSAVIEALGLLGGGR